VIARNRILRLLSFLLFTRDDQRVFGQYSLKLKSRVPFSCLRFCNDENNYYPTFGMSENDILSPRDQQDASKHAIKHIIYIHKIKLSQIRRFILKLFIIHMHKKAKNIKQTTLF